MFFGAIVLGFICVTCGVSAQQEELNICENVANNIFLTDINNCSKYFICVNGQPIQQQCEGNRYFNGDSQSCITSSSSCLQCGEDDLAFYELPRTCSKYIMCFSGSLIVRECAQGLQFNPKTKLCDIPSNVDCVANRCPIQSPDNKAIYIPSAESCQKYYICLKGVPIPQNCSGSLQFSSACECCNLKSIVGCSIAPLTRKSRNAVVHVPPQRVNIDCPKTGVQFIPHEEENRYYVCSEGQGVLLTCGEGLFYDPAIKECRELKNFEVNKS